MTHRRTFKVLLVIVPGFLLGLFCCLCECLADASGNVASRLMRWADADD